MVELALALGTIFAILWYIGGFVATFVAWSYTPGYPDKFWPWQIAGGVAFFNAVVLHLLTAILTVLDAAHPRRHPPPPLRRFRVEGTDTATGMQATQYVHGFSKDHAAAVAHTQGLVAKTVTEE